MVAALGGVLSSFVRHRALIVEMVTREIQLRFRTSVVGVLWSLLHPLLLLLVFAFVFGKVLQVRWSRAETTAEFALVLFAGLLVFNLFAECLQRAPGMIVSRVSLVKKIAFPLEILAWVQVGHALFTFAAGTLVLLVFEWTLRGHVPWTVVWLPLVVVPVVLAGLAVGWLFGALCVFVRDIEQLVGPVSMALLFLTPIFFDLAIVPEPYRAWFYANPLTFAVEQARAVLIDGHGPDLPALAAGTLIAYGCAAAALAFFRRARDEFADAL